MTDDLPAGIITPGQFAELKAMLDAYAGKEHSASGFVVASLRAILARHQEMVLLAERQRYAAKMEKAFWALDDQTRAVLAAMMARWAAAATEDLEVLGDLARAMDREFGQGGDRGNG